MRSFPVASRFDTQLAVLTLSQLKTGTATRPIDASAESIRADAERLSYIVLEMQRCFLLHLSKQLIPGNFSFPQFFLLAYLDQKEVLTMSAITQKMAHTTPDEQKAWLHVYGKIYDYCQSRENRTLPVNPVGRKSFSRP